MGGEETSWPVTGKVERLIVVMELNVSDSKEIWKLIMKGDSRRFSSILGRCVQYLSVIAARRMGGGREGGA